jgi:ornithine cyclodeaminase/alanine dehydrogenase-like protein (mu-crystallin family)
MRIWELTLFICFTLDELNAFPVFVTIRNLEKRGSYHVEKRNYLHLSIPGRFFTRRLSRYEDGHGSRRKRKIILSEIEKGFPVAVMEGTLCSNMRVGAMGGIAAKHLARKDSKVIGFIGSGEQSKMHLVAMKTVLTGLEECRVSAKTEPEEEHFIEEMQPIFPEMKFIPTKTNGQKAIEGADVIVTGTSAQAPLLKADWVKEGAFYSHIGGWEDEYAVAKKCSKIVCDDWETVKHRTQTLSRMYKDGELTDDDVYANLVELVAGDKKGRESDQEINYFNAVGLAYVDVAIAHAMYEQAISAGAGQRLTLQNSMIFEHEGLKDLIRF